MDETQLAQYNQLYQQATNPSVATSIPMTAGGSQQGLNSFLNTPEYALLYGQQNGANQAINATNGTYNPVQAFQNDPGYQYNMNQALGQVNSASAAKGLLESSAGNTSLMNTASGLQNQYYQTFLGQQNSLFGNYQNQLANLTNLGSQSTGNQNAYNLGTGLAQLLSGNYQNTASGLSNANLQTGQNISSLLANQGMFGANAQLNTGAAQANNIFQGNQFSAQIQAANLASQAGTQSSINNSSALGSGGQNQSGFSNGGLF